MCISIRRFPVLLRWAASCLPQIQAFDVLTLQSTMYIFTLLCLSPVNCACLWVLLCVQLSCVGVCVCYNHLMLCGCYPVYSHLMCVGVACLLSPGVCVLSYLQSASVCGVREFSHVYSHLLCVLSCLESCGVCLGVVLFTVTWCLCRCCPVNSHVLSVCMLYFYTHLLCARCPVYHQ